MSDEGEASGSSQVSNNKGNSEHVKKPLNAFMCYSRDMRKLAAERFSSKSSHLSTFILAHQWRSLSEKERAKYFAEAEQEKKRHLEKYADYYKDLEEKQEIKTKVVIVQKCRARFGLKNQKKWCQPCRRKKKCIMYLEKNDENNESTAMDTATSETELQNDQENGRSE